MRILLAKRRALGDTVLMSSTISALARALPGAMITALVPSAFAAVLAHHPDLQETLTYEEGAVSLLRKLRARRFDRFVQLHASPGRQWIARFSGAREKFFSIQNKEVEQAYGKHPTALEWDAFFLRSALGLAQLPVPLPEPRIHLTEEERRVGADFWRRWGVEGQRVVFLGFGASRPTKRWPPEHFARFAELLRDRLGLTPAFVVGPGEVEERFAGEVIDQLRAKALRPISGADAKGDFIHAAGLSVRELCGALAACRAYVGNDSGPKHLAVAVGIPTVTFFGPEDPVEWHPYSRERHPVLYLPGLACRSEDGGRWCGIQECRLERHRCMRDLDPIDAFALVESRINGRIV